VEVIDVLKNFQPRQDLILVKTKHPRLEVAKVVAGMSGSPIYLNDKMNRRVRLRLVVRRRAGGGVTPIRNMLDELARPLPSQIDGWPIKLLPSGAAPKADKHASLGSGQRFQGAPGEYDLLRHAEQIHKRQGGVSPSAPSALVPVSTPILIGRHVTRLARARSNPAEPAGLRAAASRW